MNEFVVYRITNLKNGRIYIGSTYHFEVRKSEHLGQLRANKHCNHFLQSDFRIYGEAAFSFEVTHSDFKTRENMLLREYELILKNKKTGLSYNIDTNCPISIPKKIKRKKWNKFPKAKKIIKRKVKGDYKIKTEFPKLDSIIENKRRREEIRTNQPFPSTAISLNKY
jgi:group I intron endonuclease